MSNQGSERVNVRLNCLEKQSRFLNVCSLKDRLDSYLYKNVLSPSYDLCVCICNGCNNID